MRRKRLLWQLYPSYLLITILSLIAVTWYASTSFQQYSLDQISLDLETRGRLAADRIIDPLKYNDAVSLQSICQELSRTAETRFTVTLPSGQVVGDSEHYPEEMDNHGDRPEIMEAIANGRGEATRYSFTLQQNMMYVAIAVKDSGKVLGVLRMSLSTSSIDETLNTVNTRIAIGGLAVVLIMAIVSYFISRRISRPLEQMRLGAKRFAEGELTHKLTVSQIQEFGSLATTMNQMAQQLYERMQTVIRQRNEQEAVLESMVEGVLAVDSEARLISANQSAENLFGIAHDEVQGKTLHEIIRNAALLEFVDNVLSTKNQDEAEITIYNGEEKHLQVHGTILKDAHGAGIGALVVLNDITRINRLETVRRDFVANVSHELKTPVTSVKGFVETLLDGAMDDPATAERFLKIIGRHADRLQAIIEDLLSLSRLEQEEDKTLIDLENGAIRPVLDSAIQAFDLKASEKNVTINLNCDENITARINAALLEQAIINLIDNALKYSDQGSKIDVEAMTGSKYIEIRVTDYGQGISGEHLPRLFERFYRIDKARSRELGGTGLGLSIVKHIAQIHGGYPKAQSTLGKGSSFSIHLPIS